MTEEQVFESETEAEIDFLHGLGTHREVGEPMDKKTLLENYIIAAKDRVYWGEIDVPVVLDYARSLLYVEDAVL